TNRPHAVGYIRVSTEQQAESGFGMDAQAASITAASRLCVALSRTFTDAAVSGSLGVEERRVLLDAIAALQRGDVLLVAKGDRLGRDVIAVAMIAWHRQPLFDQFEQRLISHCERDRLVKGA